MILGSPSKWVASGFWYGMRMWGHLEAIWKESSAGTHQVTCHITPSKFGISLISKMPRQAKSQRVKKKEASDLTEQWMQHAIHLYQKSSCKPKSLQKLCQEMEEKCLWETKKVVKLLKSTLSWCINGGRSIQEAHKESKWLLKEEGDTVVKYAIEGANCNFHFSHQQIKEHVDEIASACWGNTFPEEGVGKQWTYHFILDHYEELKAYWSCPLNSARGQAVNPVTKEGYFTLLKAVIKDKDNDNHIMPKCIYGADESGFQKGIGQNEQVFRAAGKRTQHQQHSGDRENITAIVVICEDGTAPSPTVIFKGKGFQVQWKQNNPLNTL